MVVLLRKTGINQFLLVLKKINIKWTEDQTVVLVLIGLRDFWS